jgi:L-aspartate oxidase
LLEGLVFAHRIAALVADALPQPGEPVEPGAATPLVAPAARADLQRAMTDGAGVLRSAASLEATAKTLDDLRGASTDTVGPEAWETTNLHQIATALVTTAKLREETRGCHWREDFPDRDDERWHVRLATGSGADGGLDVTREEVPWP